LLNSNAKLELRAISRTCILWQKAGIRAFEMVTRIAPCWGKALGHVTATPSAAALPGFLVPAWQTGSSQHRQFSTTNERRSKLGRIPISVPPGVELQIGEPIAKRVMTSYKPTIRRNIAINGPRGSLNLEVPEYITIDQSVENKTISLGVKDVNAVEQKEMWGTF
jgi:large subunit ribosomal protein L6